MFWKVKQQKVFPNQTKIAWPEWPFVKSFFKSLFGIEIDKFLCSFAEKINFDVKGFMLIDRLHFTWVNSLTNFMFQMNFDRHINLSIHLLSSQNSSEKPEKILCAFLNQFTNKNSLMDPNHYSGSILSQNYLKYSGFQYMESWCFRWYLRRKKRKKFK